MRKASFKVEEDEKAGQITHRETAVGLVLSTTCFLLAYVVAKKILPSIGGVSIHYFAWMVLIVCGAKRLRPVLTRNQSRRQASV